MTRASVVIYDEFGNRPICELYVPTDGYPKDFGQDLVDFCKDWKITDGIRLDLPTDFTYANGMGDFAVRLIAHFMQEYNDPYSTISLIPISSHDDILYRYTIKCSDTAKTALPVSGWALRPVVQVEGFESFSDALRESEE